MKKIILVIILLALPLGCFAEDQNYKGELSREKDYNFEWRPVTAPPEHLDAGEQPGWTKLNIKCKNKIATKDVAKTCLEGYFKTFTVNWEVDINLIKKEYIIVKHELPEGAQSPILSRNPTIKPYKIEVYCYNNSHAIDWEGNIYHYQRWA
jgi:phage terminase small subunit